SDVVSLNSSLNASNARFVDRLLLRHAKPTAFLINAARGGLVNEADLADALNEGRLAGAALDVVSQEPIRSENPLLKAKHCLLTPHIAWASLEARKRLMAATAANIQAFLSGNPRNVVN
ncbi:MAG TPA: NAD(P)-dependent oxidoreductase, partial [Candidatus Sulfotelmatobacter sp.]|nr:NAD(P)-dependent oxidoreductase [Candidatus Sulfotelmatobacter sp.]